MMRRLALGLFVAALVARPDLAMAHNGHDHGTPATPVQPAPVAPAPQVLSSGQLRALKVDSATGQPGTGLPGTRMRVLDLLPDLRPAIQEMDARNADIPLLDGDR